MPLLCWLSSLGALFLALGTPAETKPAAPTGDQPEAKCPTACGVIPAPALTSPVPPPSIIPLVRPPYEHTTIAGAPSVPAPAPAPAVAWDVRVAPEAGDVQLQVQGGGGVTMTCKEMSLKLAGDKVVHLKASGKEVCVEGPGFRVLAGSFRTAAGSEQVMLDGNVRLEYRRDNAMHTHVTAEHVIINLPSLEARVGGGNCLIVPVP